MEYLYAPWRDTYFKEKVDGCVFCNLSNHPHLDTMHHVLYRDEICFIVMNRYPYSAGHFMVIPHYHTDALENLDEQAWLHMSHIIQQCVKMLKIGLEAQGVNLGMNLGKSAGAGIAEHIHYHIIPRWIGDTNFITTVANTRVYSTDFEKIYQTLKDLIPEFISC
ncbi:MAG: HIT domain-containing protein [Sulfurospirillaceae bacterium]|nr:HIT domain-containing protein [Sulfurospirillaceae bacterium]MDD2827764.1 HIT domain-containing protein [Sulfurospirillaceae bacterium]